MRKVHMTMIKNITTAPKRLISLAPNIQVMSRSLIIYKMNNS